MLAATLFQFVSLISPTGEGLVRNVFKTPWRDGTTRALLERLNFVARPSALNELP